MHGVLRRQCPTVTLGVGHLISAFVYRILKWIFHKAKANRERTALALRCPFGRFKLSKFWQADERRHLSGLSLRKVSYSGLCGASKNGKMAKGNDFGQEKLYRHSRI